MKKLNRVALYEWEGERSRIRNLEPHELAFQQVMRFEVEELRQKADELGVDNNHPAAAIGQLLEHENVGQDFDEEPLNDEEHEVVHGDMVRNQAVEHGDGDVGADNDDDDVAEHNQVPVYVTNRFIQD
jgi:hypothetical protein